MWRWALLWFALLCSQLQAQPAQERGAGNAGLRSIAGQAMELAVDGRGNSYVLSPDGTPWVMRAGAAQTWSRLPGTFAHLRAGAQGSLWAITADARAYVLRGSWWQGVRADVQDVAISPSGEPLFLSSEGKVLVPETLPSTDVMYKQAIDDFERIALDEHGLLWQWRKDGALRRFDGVAWKDIQDFKAVGLRDLSLGTNGAAMAVTGQGQVMQRDSRSGRWNALAQPSNAQRVALSPWGGAWYALASGQILSNAQAQPEVQAAKGAAPALFTRLLSWRKLRGYAQSISVAMDGTAVALDTNQQAWRLNSQEQWTPLVGRFIQMAAAPGGKLWGIDPQNRLLRQEGSQWMDSGIAAQAVAAGAGQEIWAIDQRGQLGRYDAARRNWQMVNTPSPVQAVSIDSRNEPWVIGAAGLVHQRLGERWHAIPGIEARSIAVGSLGAVYASTPSLQLFWLDRVSLEWKPVTGTARSVATGPSDRPWVIDEQNSLLMAIGRDQPDERTVPLPGGISPQAPPALITIAPPAASILPTLNRPLVYTSAGSSFRDVGIGADGTVFAAGAGGGLYCFTNANRQFQMAAAGTVNRVAVSPSGNPWVINAFGQLSYFEKGAWILVPGIAAQDVSISANGAVFVAQVDRAAVYSFNPASRELTEVSQYSAGIPLRAKRIAAGSNALWAITPANQLLQCSGNACKLKNISAADIAVGPEGSVFAIDLNGSLQRYNVRTDAFLKVNGQGSSVAVGQQGLPWLVSPSGEIQYAGLFATSSKSINASNCAEKFAVAPVPQVPNPVAVLVARTDALSLNPGASASILVNDSLNGRVPNFDQVRVTLSSASALLRYERGQIVLASTATPGSTLAASYLICAEPGAVPCARAAISVQVLGTPTVTISATADSATLAPGGTLNLLANDSLNGSAPSSAQVSVSFASLSPQLTQAGGLLSLNAAATAGSSHTASYRICAASTGSPCSSTVSVVITVPIGITISATADSAPLNPGGTLNLLANDNLNGSAPTSGQVNVSFASQSAQLTQVGGLLTLNAAATLGSSHTASYRICAAPAGTPCSNTVSIIISVPIGISANTDTATLSPSGTLNLLANDSLNGSAPTSGQVNVSFASLSAQLTQVGGLLTLNAAAAPGSSHTASYSICSLPGGTPCSSTVTVVINVLATISATADTASLSPGGTLNLLANDSLNGNVPTSAQVNINFASLSPQLTQVAGLLTLNSAATPGSSHTASYSICALPGGTPCSSTVTVIINVPATISATADSATLVPGGTLNLLANDNLNGSAPTSGQVNVNFASLSPQLTQVGGLLTLNAAAAAGSSNTASYSICALPGSTPCSSTVTVVINVLITVVANPDTYTFPLSTLSGAGVHDNDTLDGVLIPPGSPDIEYTLTGHVDKFILYPDGFLQLDNVVVPQVGQTYVVPYTVCQTGVPTNCASSNATVTIGPAP